MFNFNGIDFSKLVQTMEIKRPFLGNQTISTTSLEGRAGSIFHRKITKDFEISIKFMIKENSPIELMNKIREVANLLDTSEPRKLILNDEPDKYIMAIISSTNLDKESKYAIGTVTFYCPDPYWYAINDDIVIGTSGTKTYTRKGTAESYPLIEIKGDCRVGKITISTEYQTMIFSGTMNPSDKLIIDSALLTAYIEDGLGSRTSVIPYLDNLDFPICYAGENTINISGSSGASVSSYKVYCNSRWK